MPALGGVNSTTSVATSAELTAHTDDATAAHAASAIAFTPAGTVAATTVQAAIEEVAAEASGSGIPQGGPLTEDFLTDGNGIKGADDGDGTGARLDLNNSADGRHAAMAGGDGAAGLPGGAATFFGGPGDAGSDIGARFIANPGDGSGGHGLVEIRTNNDDGSSGDLLTAQGDGTALWAVPVLQRVTVDLDAADIATLNSVPVEGVAAPGANKVIVPLLIALQFQAGATPYETAIPEIRLGTQAIGIMFSDAGLDGADDTVSSLSSVGLGHVQADVANQPLRLSADLDPDTDGDGTARLTVLYYVFDLAV